MYSDYRLALAAERRRELLARAAAARLARQARLPKARLTRADLSYLTKIGRPGRAVPADQAARDTADQPAAG